MKKVIAFLIGMAAVVYASLPAVAAHRGNPAPVASGPCPYSGAGYPDGCLTAPHVGLFQDATFFNNTANFNGRTLSARPPWDVPGIDFGVGQYTTDGSLLDPTNSSNLPPNCAYSTHVVLCNGTGSLTITGLYFNDVCLDIHGSYSSVTIINNHFKNGTNTNNRTNCFWLVNLEEQGVNTSWDQEFNTFDGAGNTGLHGTDAYIEDQRFKAHSSSTKNWYSYLANTTSKYTITDHCGDQSWRYNAAVAWPAPSGDLSHAEFQIFCFDSGATVNNTESIFNFAFEDPAADNTEQAFCGGTTAIDYISSGQNFSVTYQTVTDSNNVYVIPASNNTSNQTCAGHTANTKVQAEAAIVLQQATYGTLNVNENWIFPTGAYYCMESNSPVTIGTLNMGSNRNMFDNSTISNTISSNTCTGHGS